MEGEGIGCALGCRAQGLGQFIWETSHSPLPIGADSACAHEAAHLTVGIGYGEIDRFSGFWGRVGLVGYSVQWVVVVVEQTAFRTLTCWLAGRVFFQLVHMVFMLL